MAEMPRQLTQAEIDRILFRRSMGLDPRGRVPMPSIQNINVRDSGTITAVPENFFQLSASGAAIMGDFLNRILPNAQQVVAANPLNLEALFPTNNAQPQVTIPTGFNFGPKQQPTGEVTPGGLQTTQVNLNQLLGAVKPADVVGLTGMQNAYTDLGMGKAPNPMDVLDAATFGASGIGASKALLRGATKTGKYIAPTVGNLLDDYAAKTGLQMYAYRPTTPKKPDPSVGTRFEREFIGGLADKTPVKIEDYKDASLMILPWDSSSRNFKIKSVSDILLPQQYITHGGQDYARDLEHMDQNIVGASNRGIAERIANRNDFARQENLLAGGSGNVIHMPSTMGQYGENFSVQPINLLLGIADSGKLSKASIKAFDQSIKDFKVPVGVGEKRVVTQPFKDFKGIMTEEGRAQLYAPDAGELRKAATNRFYLKKAGQNNQQLFGFNAEDVVNAITDEALLGVPKGYIGNTVFMAPRSGMKLTKSANPTYDTDFSGQYLGTLGTSVPVEVLMPKTFERIAKELSGKNADLRNMTIGAMEKRNEGVSEIIDDRVIESYYNYLKNQKAKGLLD